MIGGAQIAATATTWPFPWCWRLATVTCTGSGSGGLGVVDFRQFEGRRGLGCRFFGYRLLGWRCRLLGLHFASQSVPVRLSTGAISLSIFDAR